MFSLFIACLTWAQNQPIAPKGYQLKRFQDLENQVQALNSTPNPESVPEKLFGLGLTSLVTVNRLVTINWGYQTFFWRRFYPIPKWFSGPLVSLYPYSKGSILDIGYFVALDQKKWLPSAGICWRLNWENEPRTWFWGQWLLHFGLSKLFTIENLINQIGFHFQWPIIGHQRNNFYMGFSIHIPLGVL